jgi:hypothetical protein
MSRLEFIDTAVTLRDGDAIDRAIAAAHRHVILRHRQLGIPLVIWKDGKVVEVSAESIELPTIEP